MRPRVARLLIKFASLMTLTLVCVGGGGGAGAGARGGESTLFLFGSNKQNATAHRLIGKRYACLSDIVAWHFI